MNKVSKCLNRRYEIIDSLVRELSACKLVEPSASPCRKVSKNLVHYVWNLNKNNPPNEGSSPRRQRVTPVKERNFQCYNSRYANWPDRCILKSRESVNHSIEGIVPPGVGEASEAAESGGVNAVAAEAVARLHEQYIAIEPFIGFSKMDELPEEDKSFSKDKPNSLFEPPDAPVLESDELPAVSEAKKASEPQRVSKTDRPSNLPAPENTSEATRPPESLRRSSAGRSSNLSNTNNTSEATRPPESLRRSSAGRSSNLSNTNNTSEATRPRESLQGFTAGRPCCLSETENTSEATRPFESPRQSTAGRSSNLSKTNNTSEATRPRESLQGSTAGRPCCLSETENTTEATRPSKTLRESTAGRLSYLSKSNNTSEATRPGESVRGSTVARPYYQSENPLHQAFENSKQAAQFNGECMKKINELMVEQKTLVDEIRRIEYREKEGMKLLQEADEMWTRMEENYKNKLEEVNERKENLSNQFSEVDKSIKKWKDMKKDLESQIDNIEKTVNGMDEKHRRRINDIRSLEKQIANLEKTADASKREMEATEKNLLAKKKHSDSVAETIGNKIAKLTQEITEECHAKADKEKNLVHYINQCRADLQKLWKALLQRKLQNEELRLQEETLTADINLLKENEVDCTQRCSQRQETVLKEIERMDENIATYKIKCSRCHQEVDTSDMKKICSECHRCDKVRRCMQKGDICTCDPDEECVCVSVKEKFMENVFENMNEVLQKQVETEAGKAVSEVVLKCLKHSRNGKIDEATRRVLKDFILTTVRKHLNTTIVGGAVKTRCEMDSETYTTLMQCVAETTLPEIPKEDKSTIKKSPCSHWEGTSECKCANGPKDCVCAKKVPRGGDSTVYPLFKYDRDKGGPRKYHPKDTDGRLDRPDRLGSSKQQDLPSDQMATGRAPQSYKGGACCSARNNQNPKESIVLCDSHGSQECCTSEQHSTGPSLYESCRDSDTEQTRSLTEMNKYLGDNLCLGVCSVKRNLKSYKNNQRLSFCNDCFKGRVTSEFTSRHCNNKKDIKDEGISKNMVGINRTKRVIRKIPKRREDDVIELTRTPSGKQALAFNKKIISEIHQKLNESFDMQVFVKKINKDRFSLRINNEKSDDYEVVKIRKTPSGNLFLDGPKYVLQPTTNSATISTQQKAPTCSKMENSNNKQNSVKLWNKTRKGKCKYHVDGVSNVALESNSDERQNKRHRNYLADSVLKPQVYSVAVKPDIKKTFLKIISKKMECKSGYTKDKKNEIAPADKKSDKLHTNTVLKSVSNRMKQKSVYHKEQPLEKKNNSKGEFHKKTVKDLFYNKAFVPPAERTLSVNTFAIEKKDKKPSQNVISQNVLMNEVKITKSHSSTAYLYVEKDDETQDSITTKSILTTSLSGDLKLLVSNEDTKEHSIKKDKNIEVVGSNKIHKNSECIFSKKNSTNSESVYRRKQSSKTVKASSDLILPRGKCDGTNNNKGCLLSITTKSIKKTESGTYNLILDKYSKQKFISNIQNLVENAKGTIPILKADNGDIKIQLNQKEESKNKEYLRITPSGNLYLSVNKKRVESLNVHKADSKKNTGPSLKVEKLVNMKKTEERCNRKQEVHRYTELSKKYDEDSFTSSLGKRHSLKNALPSRNNFRHNHEINTEYDDSCIDNDYFLHKNEDWFCMTHVPYEKSYMNLSNEIKDEVPKRCDEKALDSKHIKDKRNANLVKDFFWNNIEKLPPQLPVFLRDNNFTKIR